MKRNKDIKTTEVPNESFEKVSNVKVEHLEESKVLINLPVRTLEKLSSTTELRNSRVTYLNQH